MEGDEMRTFYRASFLTAIILHIQQLGINVCKAQYVQEKVKDNLILKLSNEDIFYCISFKYTDLHKIGVHALNHTSKFKDQLHQHIIYIKFSECSQSYTLRSHYHNQHTDDLHQPFPVNPHVFSSVPHTPTDVLSITINQICLSYVSYKWNHAVSTFCLWFLFPLC